MKSRFYTAQEVAEMLGVHQSTAYKIINFGNSIDGIATDDHKMQKVRQYAGAI